MIRFQYIEDYTALVLRSDLRIGEQNARCNSGIQLPKICLEHRIVLVRQLETETLPAVDGVFQPCPSDQKAASRHRPAALALLRALLGALRGRLILALGLCGRSALALLWVLLSALWGCLIPALGLRGWSALTLLWALLGALRGRLVLALGLRGRSALALLWELLGALRGRLVLALGLCGRPVLALLSF